MSPRVRLSLVLVGAVAAAAIAMGAIGWTASDRLEQDNQFCLSCHLEPGVRLHDAIGNDFIRHPPASLAALHAGARAEKGDDREFRCIDCHGGTSWPGRTRVKLLAAVDGLWYAAGHFAEPTEMAWQLWDEDCRKCHAQFDTTRSEALMPRFHELSGHNKALGVGCVECHRIHDGTGDPNRAFVRADHVEAQCARCHLEFRKARP